MCIKAWFGLLNYVKFVIRITWTDSSLENVEFSVMSSTCIQS